MDPENFLEIANQVTKLRMYPYFEMAHCIISCLYMREDLAQGEFSRNDHQDHPTIIIPVLVKLNHLPSLTQAVFRSPESTRWPAGFPVCVRSTRAAS